MHFVSELVADKGRRVFTIHPSATVLDAVREMDQSQVGSLAVVVEGRLVGIITERDYARRGILRGRRSDETLVEEIMSTNPKWVTPSETIDNCMQIMTRDRVRHLPVMQGAALVGLVSIGDLVKAIIERQRATIDHLKEYIAS
jgi:CBS domain-containing protein